MHTAFKVLSGIPNLQFSWHGRRTFHVKINFFNLCTLQSVVLEPCVYPHSKKATVNSSTDFLTSAYQISIYTRQSQINRLHSSVVFMFIQVLSPLSWDCQQAQFINWHLQNTPLFTRTDPISSQWLHSSDTNTKWAVATKGKFTCNELNKRVQRQKSLQNVEASCRMFWKACLKCFKIHCDYQGITHKWLWLWN